jgi:hypothetical protein
MTDAAIVASARTAIGTAITCSLSDVDADCASGLAAVGGGISTALVLDVPPPGAPSPTV